jgi:3-deoxy-D-manno-octulosonate 8-phosphate phosphatase KdsC-like HAD superfamily phosphatase
LVAAGDKLPPLRQWLARHGLEPAHTVYVGNDEPDVPCMRYVGCAVAPADAYPPARAAAHIVLTTPGGYGCLRELAGLLLT